MRTMVEAKERACSIVDAVFAPVSEGLTSRGYKNIEKIKYDVIHPFIESSEGGIRDVLLTGEYSEFDSYIIIAVYMVLITFEQEDHPQEAIDLIYEYWDETEFTKARYAAYNTFTKLKNES